MSSPSVSANIEQLLKQSREAAYELAVLSTAEKNQALAGFAQLLAENTAFILAENKKDLDAQANQIAPSLYQRLKLDDGKILQLIQGIQDVCNLPDPVGQTLSKTQLDEGLVLEKVSVPLGVIGIVFESRPDVIPQILSLTLKSGNSVVLKGGKEAFYSNQAMMQLANQLPEKFPWLPKAWAQLLDSRQAVQEMLAYSQYVDLIIPRGSNQLVQSIMASTKIPVMGHADGICHLYVHASASLTQAVSLAVDAKVQYPAACNALETLLVDAAIASDFLPLFATAAQGIGITLKGCETTQSLLKGIEPATEVDWRTEYGDLTLSIKVVDGLSAAISHINTFGSHHTDGILGTDPLALEQFMNQVDSANVFANASTRFADGFRYGLGAEIGISTAKTHARGPVGLEGLVIYKYKLRGAGHIVSDYVGKDAKPFIHRSCP